MRRREFLKASAATLVLPSIPLVKAEEKPQEAMTLEVFCRNVLKVELIQWQQHWVELFDGRVPNSAFTAHNVSWDRLTREGRFGDWGHTTPRIFLAVYVALYLAYTQPENKVWIHEWKEKLYLKNGNEITINAFNIMSYVPLLCGKSKDEKVKDAFCERIWPIEAKSWPEPPEEKPGDWHIYC